MRGTMGGIRGRAGWLAMVIWATAVTNPFFCSVRGSRNSGMRGTIVAR